MDLVALTEYLVKKLVKNPNSAKFKINMIEESDAKIIQVLVDNNSMGSLIGKGGMVANAIRTIVQASSYHNNLGKVRVNIDTM